MKDGNALSSDAIDLIEDLDDNGLGAITEHFSGAELAGLVRSAASYALARAVESDGDGMVTAADLKKALGEVRPALGTQASAIFSFTHMLSFFCNSCECINVLWTNDRMTYLNFGYRSESVNSPPRPDASFEISTVLPHRWSLAPRSCTHCY